MLSSTALRYASHLLVLAILIVLPALWFQPTVVWKLAPDQGLLLGAFAVAYLAAVYLALRIGRADGRLRFSRVVLTGAAVLGACFAVLAIWAWMTPEGPSSAPRHYSMATSLLLAFACLLFVLGANTVRLWRPAVLAVVLGIGIAGQAAYFLGWLPRPPMPARTVRLSNTSLYELEIVTYENWIPKHWRKGGGLTPWGADTLIATGDGFLYLMKGQGAGDTLSVTPLPRTVPLNADEFVVDSHEMFRKFKRQNIEASRFRIADVLVMEHGEASRIYVTHHFWNRASHCYVLRLSMLEGSRAQILDARTPLTWKTVFDTSPCLELNSTNPSGPRFEGLENGGRMARLNDSEVLLSVGDHGFNGVSRPEQLSQDSTSSYGKVLRVNVETGTASIWTRGHRNPQGLFLATSGAVWSTEHGPRGGDEVNLLKEGGNYGWPVDTFGTEYSRLSWPLNPDQELHTGFERPVYAFVPSVGISNLTQYDGSAFPLWRGDLLVGSLNGRTLYRMRTEQNHVVLVEPIPLKRSVRDVMVGSDGGLVIWTDERDIVFIRPTGSREGDALTAACTGCHGFNSWDRATVGPQLSRIFGRPVASGNDFEYSEALRDFGGRWTRQRLDDFLEDPQGIVPGTLMTFPGIKDEVQRKKLIDFLETMPVD